MRARTLAIRASLVALQAALILALGLPVAYGAKITRVDVVNKPERVIITVQGDCPLKMMPFASLRGKFVGFQFPCQLAEKGRLVPIKSGSIYNVRISSFKARPPIARIVVNTRAHCMYSTNWSSDRKRIEISVLKTLPKPQPDVKVKPAIQEVSGPGRINDMTDAAETTDVASESESASAEPAAGNSERSLEQPASKPRLDPLSYKRFARATSATDEKPMSTAETEAGKYGPVEARPQVIAGGDSGTAEGDATRVMSGSQASSVSSDEPKIGQSTPQQETVRPKIDPAGYRRFASADARIAAIPSRDTAQPTSWPSEKRVSLNFLGADINDVLKALAVQSGRNIVAGKDVTGNITVSLSQVTVEEALDYVAKLSGYTYTEENGTYLVASHGNLSKLRGGGENTEVVALNYANADDVVALLKTQYPEVQAAKATVQAQTAPKGSSAPTKARLVLSGPPEKLAQATELIARVEDSMKEQSAEEKRVLYRIKYVNASELKQTLLTMVPGIRVNYAPTEGFDLEAPSDIKVGDAGASISKEQKTSADSPTAAASTRGGSQSAGGELEPKNKVQALIISGRVSDVENALALADQLDVKAPQIKIDAKITSITESGEKKLGLTWEWDKIAFIETGTEAWKRDGFNFAATLDALLTSGDAKLLASPSIVCLENKPGVFFVGDDVTYIVRVEVTPTGQNVQTETKSVGVQLRVIGDVSSDNLITLNLHPEVSTLKLTENKAANIFLPVVSRRFTDHVVRVKSGQTIVLGGLIREDEVEALSKVPLLGDIPFFGNLFQHRHKTRDRTEVVMFITATVLED